MGLAEKRWVAEKKKTDEPVLVSQIKVTLGFDVPVEIDWEGFSADLKEASYIMDDTYGLPNLVKALASITLDDLGKEAIQGALNKISVQAAKADGASFAFENGAITWKAYFGSSSSGYIYADAMKTKLEAGL
jgi:hypothetical protein